ncbi:MoaD/ThiS family protein [Carboxydothermus hydrogenoformans]|uniref:MoaD/ThiS family protein n=1 Tax=Carboxydothermus hydrogenoformans TaxID=129958 RepID=UPI0005A14F1B|nr:MoaD/ThiS family protein [Carboxydothermus hydrogenoformans]
MSNISVQVKVDNFLLKNSSRLKACHEIVEVPEQSTISTLLEIIGLNKDLISFVTVNGERKDLAYRLQENDVVAFYPYISGG